MSPPDGIGTDAALELDDPLTSTPPRLSLDEAQGVAERIFGIRGTASRLHSERDANFRIDAEGGSFVLKIYNPAEPDAVVDMQTAGMLHVATADPALPVPRVVETSDGLRRGVLEHEGRNHAVQLVTFLDGRVAVPREFDLDALHVFGATVARVGRALRGFFHPGAGRTLLWDAKHALDLRPLLAEVEDPGRRAAAASALDRFEERVVPMLGRLRAQVIHNDLTFDNVLVDGELRPTAIVDFGDMTHSPLLFDVAVALASFCVEPDLFDRAAAFIEGYERMTPLESAERDLLADAVSARLAANVLISAWRVRRFPDNADYITAFDADTWPALELFDELDDTEVRRRLTGGGRQGDRPAEDLVERRRRAFGPAALPLSYDRPIHMVRAEGVWMFDADGRRYLDAYNNVPVVGHSHPRVVEALATQARELNTNMRYLHETAIELAERLTGTMPAGLDHCVFVNSGSEANELAWRFAKTVTGADGCLVSRWAYHGVTSATFDFSPEDWPQGEGPAYVGTIPPPDGFRGPHRRGAAEWWRPYLEDVRGAVEALQGRGHGPAALLLDSVWTSDGIFTDAPPYVAAAADFVRDEGGVFIGDEVQAGFGRLGTMWSFTPTGAAPDLVTLGKPMGNGHPIGAVVMRSEVAAEFVRRESPVFSTFGGNPVACAAALAVLDVLEEEDLVANAAQTGAHMLQGLHELAATAPAIGDVRGEGLLAGVELVANPETREPAPDLARAVLNGVREGGVLIGVTGSARNVLKIRPPLPFRPEHADLLVEALAGALRRLDPV